MIFCFCALVNSVSKRFPGITPSKSESDDDESESDDDESESIGGGAATTVELRFNLRDFLLTKRLLNEFFVVLVVEEEEEEDCFGIPPPVFVFFPGDLRGLVSYY